MLRETTFWIGGALTFALGVALAVGLYWAGAGVEYFDAWLASALALGFGVFFVHVAREEHRDRLDFLTGAEQDSKSTEKPGRE